MTQPRRANPARTLEAILNSRDRATALDRLTRALGATWEAGADAGWRAGIDDANEDNPKPLRPNPYRSTATTGSRP